MKFLTSLVMLTLGCTQVVEAFSTTSHIQSRRIHTFPLRLVNGYFSSKSISEENNSPSTLNLWRVPEVGLGRRKTNLPANLGLLGQKLRRWTRKTLLVVGIFLAINFGFGIPASARGGIRTGGRVGGSFGAPTTRPPVMRSMPQSYHQRQRPSQIRVLPLRRPHIHVHSSPQYRIGESARFSSSYAAPARRHAVSSDLFFAGAVGTVVALNVVDKLQREKNQDSDDDTRLGSGTSVVSITMAINVPDRDSPNSILARLSRLANNAPTDTRKGVQDLMTGATLELLRQRDSIVSVDSSYSHFNRLADAQRAFNTLSLGGRSKYDEETASNFGGDRSTESRLYANIDKYPRATVAVVTINICIAGDSTKFTKIKNRNELQSALSRIASDCQVDDCLVSAEVLWSPECRSERITSEDVYVDYPSLFPLYD